MNCMLHRWWLRQRIARLDADIAGAEAGLGAWRPDMHSHELRRVVEGLCITRAVARVRLDSFEQQRQPGTVGRRRYADSR
jgi:hypothetical protein